MSRRWLVATLLAGITRASDPAPIAFEPGQWLGDDGNWSTVAVEVGSPAQKVGVLVSTALSEVWVVGPGGCLPNEPVCDAARGGVFTPAKSNSWKSLGAWELGLSYYTENGDYGREMVSGTNPINGESFSISNISVAAINTTQYYQGLFGLGIARGDFDDGAAVDSPLTAAAITKQSIPSVSYGYTAGAHYRNTPASLTLGGFDAARHVSHNTKFTLTQEGNLPCPLVRGIELAGAGAKNASEQQLSPKNQVLSEWKESFLAVIDSTTPYLWLPGWLCDRFAKALDLTYNQTYDLYTVSNSQYQAYSSSDAPSFTFSLSSLDNRNDLGEPLRAPGVVNITVSAQAFINLLQYPFKDQAIRYGDPAVPYFALRRSQNNSTFVFGRAFLQEAYLITRYDEAAFSVHSAVFPDDPVANANVVAIEQGDNSPYVPIPTAEEPSSHKLKQGQIIGISVGAALGFLVSAAAAWFFHRRRTSSKGTEDAELAKSYRSPSSSVSETSQRTIGQLLFRIIKRKQPSPSPSPNQSENEKEGTELKEAPNTQIHELPVPMRPVELDGANGEDDIIGEDPRLGESPNSGSYEAARQRMERQLQGPVPEYSPPLDGELPPPEKSIHYPEEQPTATYIPSAGTDPWEEGGANIDPPSTPTNAPRASWTRRLSEIPPPITLPGNSVTQSGATLFPSSPSPCHPSDELGVNSTMGQSLPSPLTPATVPMHSPSVAMHRSPITTSNIVCLGPLPENVQLSRHSSIPYMPPTAAQDVFPPSPERESRPSLDTLGSDYTETEEQMEATPESRAGLETSSDQAAIHHALARLSSFPLQVSPQSTEPGSLGSGERVGSSTDLVHVPQMAAQRYSWEDER